MTVYAFIKGPLLWIALWIFTIGTILKVFWLFSISFKKDKIIYQHLNWKYIFKSIIHWVFPLNKAVLKNPFFTLLSYIFHICLIGVPIWLEAHIMLWKESWLGWSWAPMPSGLADWMTLACIAIGLYLLARRFVSRDIRFISTPSDYILIILTLLPFATGYFLSHGTLNFVSFLNENMEILHILSAEILLIMIPFTKLSHFTLFFLSRGVIGAEFGRRGVSI
jgi:nitrate reductase gamma subunit